MCDPGSLDIFERDGFASVIGTDRPAEEPVAMKHPDFSNIARVVSDGDWLTHVGGESRVDVAEPLEVNAVAPHNAGLCDHDQQQIQIFQAVGHASQPTIAKPAWYWRDASLAMHPGIMGPDKISADCRVEIGQYQGWGADRLPQHKMAWQLGQQFRVQRSKQALPTCLAAVSGAGAAFAQGSEPDLVTVGGVVALRGLFSVQFEVGLASFGHDFGPRRGDFGVARRSIWAGRYGSAQCKALSRGQSAAQKGAAAGESASTILRP